MRPPPAETRGVQGPPGGTSASIPKAWSIAGLSLATVLAVAACSSSDATTAPTNAPATSTGAGGAAIPTPPAANITLQGAGSTFPALLDPSWFEAYGGLYLNVRVDHQAVGHGDRPRADGPLAAHDLERAGDRITQIAEDVVFLATNHVEDLNE